MTTAAGQTRSISDVVLHVALLLCMLAALGLFAYRGGRVGLKQSDDFILIYTPARALLTGVNPYDQADIDRVWVESGGSPDLRPSLRHDSALIYPLTTLAMLSPFAALTWPAAKYAWVFANLGFLAVVLACIARLAGFTLRERRTWAFITLALMFMPVHTSFRMGQTPIMVLAMIMAAFSLVAISRSSDGRIQQIARWRSIVSGVLLGVASLIKPQIGVPFLAFEVLRMRWLTLLSALTTIALIALVATLPITLRGVPWWDNWNANLNSFTTGNVGDPTPINPVRHQLLNLHYPLHNFIENRAGVKILVLAIATALALVHFRRWIMDLSRMFWRNATGDAMHLSGRGDATIDPLLSLCMIAVLTLMIVYHRFYDGVLLLLPLAWAVRALSVRRGDWLAWCVMALLLPYFANLATGLKMLEQRAALPSWILDQWWWNDVLLPSQAWALLAIAMCLLPAGERERKTTPVRDNQSAAAQS